MLGHVPFPFRQNPSTRDCGFRCLYYVVNPGVEYDEWLKTLLHKNPERSGLKINHIATHLRNKGFEVESCSPEVTGLYIIYSTGWLSSGHYLVYHDGLVYDSVDIQPRRMSIEDFKAKAGTMITLKIRKPVVK